MYVCVQAANDLIRIRLSGFTGAERTAGQLVAQMLSGAAAASFDATSSTWTEETKSLQLVLALPVGSGVATTVTVGTDAGIQMPRVALAANDGRLKIGYEPSAVAAARECNLAYCNAHTDLIYDLCDGDKVCTTRCICDCNCILRLPGRRVREQDYFALLHGHVAAVSFIR